MISGGMAMTSTMPDTRGLKFRGQSVPQGVLKRERQMSQDRTDRFSSAYTRHDVTSQWTSYGAGQQERCRGALGDIGRVTLKHHSF